MGNSSGKTGFHKSFDGTTYNRTTMAATKGKRTCCGEKAKHTLRFGRGAVGQLESDFATVGTLDELSAKVPAILSASYPKANTIKGERGAKTACQMIQAAYSNGLFTLGDMNSPVNKQIRPALKFIFHTANRMKPKDPKRVAMCRALAEACLDCQQVQAREILRVFGELTNQNATLNGQILFFFAKQKEEALYRVITEQHPRCDESYKTVGSGGQRAHLKSAYLVLLGEGFGMQNVKAAQADRFLSQAQPFVKLTRAQLIERITQYCCPERLVRELLADINNQKAGAERLISRKCIFDWVKKNMSQEDAFRVFYDEDRADEFKGMEPEKPTDENQYEPFLSPVVLTDILVKMNIVRRVGDESGDDTPMDIDDDDDDDATKTSSDGDVIGQTVDDKAYKWQVNLGGGWQDFSPFQSTLFESAYPSRNVVPFTFGRWSYVLDPNAMVQRNTQTNKTRAVRRVPRS